MSAVEEKVATVHYCDKVFDLPDRTDESWSRCRWSDSLSPGSLTDCEGGLECEGECVHWSDWCPPQPGSSTVWREIYPGLSLVELLHYCPLIGRELRRNCWHQFSYAIKPQVGDFGCDKLVLYGIRELAPATH